MIKLKTTYSNASFTPRSGAGVPIGAGGGGDSTAVVVGDGGGNAKVSGGATGGGGGGGGGEFGSRGITIAHPPL